VTIRLRLVLVVALTTAVLVAVGGVAFAASLSSGMRATLEDSLRFTAYCRLYLGADIPNIQTSWVKLGPEGVAESLRWGANDFGGTLMEESITRMSGASHGQNLDPDQIEAAIRSVGRTPRERNTIYGPVSARPRDLAPSCPAMA